jgi:hypothetical protein
MTNTEGPTSPVDESGGSVRRAHIEATLNDMIVDLFYYDRKEDENLPIGAIEAAVLAGEITETEIIEQVTERLREALRGQV